MAKDSIAKQKSMNFSVRIVRLYKYLCNEHKEFVLSKQVLRSGTSIGANIAEALYGSSRNDFAAKLQIAEKEASETLYWLELLNKCDYLPDDLCRSLSSDCNELISILATSIKSTKQ